MMRMLQKVLLVTGLLLAMLAARGFGQEDTDEGADSGTDTSSGAQELPVDPESQADNSNAGEDDSDNGEEPVDDDFIPSTQISEDLSVSFPVDI